MLIEWICTKCGHGFLNGKFRSVCFDCSPIPIPVLKEVLVADYESGLSYMDLTKKYGITIHTASAYISNYGTSRTNFHDQKYQNITLDLDWLDGWLLGDGSLAIREGHKNTTARHSSKFNEYTTYVRNKWLQMGLTASEINPYWNKKGSWQFSSESRAHPSLTEQWERWYPSGCKCIPLDCRFNRVSIREWYLGDGTRNSVQGNPRFIMGNVDEVEAEFARMKLSEVLGFQVTKFSHRKKGKTKDGCEFKLVWDLYIQVRFSQRFFEFIGPCNLPCYSYKWPSVEQGLS